ncbi:MAG: ABC transporter permease [Thermoleophilia bacterium]|nr:ABC transporter permease [Thermoleophilia bacterium]
MRTRMNFYFSEAVRSLATNKATSIAAVVAMFVALLIVGAAAVGFVKMRAQSAAIQQDASMVKVFLKGNITPPQMNTLQAAMSGDRGISKVEYVNKDEALRRAKKLFEKNPGIMDNLAGNPFPASLEATLRDPKQMSSVASAYRGEPGVKEVKTGGAEARRAITILQWATAVFFAVGIGILIAATVLVSNTIRLSIYSRRREIEVMKLVGASNSFVRMPFMIEGFVCGVVASLLAMAAVVGLVKLLAHTLQSLLGNSTTIGTADGGAPIGLIALGLLALGIALGMFGSASSMRKYLKT